MTHPTISQKAVEAAARAQPRPVHPEMMLEMLWRDELLGACERLRVSLGKRPTRPEMIRKLLELPVATLQREVCAELRGRDALWRADPPLRPTTERERQ